MTWVRIDDQFPDHPKVSAAGPLAGWLHLCGLCYCNRLLTDGFIPTEVAHRLTDFTGVGIDLGSFADGMASFGDDASCEWMAEKLCEVGLWKKVKRGYKIHDYLDYQPSKATVQAEREAARIRMAKTRFARSSGEVQMPPPIPSPKSKDLIPFVSSYAENRGHESHDSGQGRQPFDKLHRAVGGSDEALTKLRRTWSKPTDAACIAALEACTGPGVRDRLAVALAELKKQRPARR